MLFAFLHSSLGQKIACVARPTRDQVGMRSIIIRDSLESRTFLENCKMLDLEFDGACVAYYYSTGETVCLNFRLENMNMDILSQLDTRAKEAEIIKAKEKQRVLIAPMPQNMPDDGVFSYVPVTGLADIISVDPSKVYLFSDTTESKQTLAVLVEHPDLFDCYPVVMVGLEQADYNAEFSNLTWKCEQASYHTLVGDIVEETRAQRFRAESQKGTLQKETDRRTTRTGQVRQFERFDVAKPKLSGSPAREESDIADDDGQ